MLDPGHSPRAPGAMGCSGTMEYQYNNKLVKTINYYLELNGVKVSLTKEYEAESALQNRAIVATSENLLLFIHHDSVQPQFISGEPNQRGRCSGKADGFSLFVSRWNPKYQESLSYARKLGKALIKRGLHPTLHHAEAIPGENKRLLDEKLGIYAYDEMVVLNSSKIPAVLLEAAVIVNPDDEKRADSINFRQSVAEAVLEMLH